MLSCDRGGGEIACWNRVKMTGYTGADTPMPGQWRRGVGGGEGGEKEEQEDWDEEGRRRRRLGEGGGGD